MTRVSGERLRLRVAQVDDAVFDLDPDEAGGLSGREPGVRALPQSADDRATGVHCYETTVDGWVFEVAVESEVRAVLRERAGQGSGRGADKGSDVVKAQIPGRVVRLWVAEGDTVEAGQRLLAIEAMKMENEVRAPRAGTIESISVAADSSVELGSELLRLR
jgi:biotin carboxyl carrier protein